MHIFLHWPRWRVKLDATKRPTNFMDTWYSNIIHLKVPQRAGGVVRMDECRIPTKLQDVLDDDGPQERLLRKIGLCFFFLIFCWPCISIYLFLIINQLHALNFIIPLLQVSTCFEHMCSSSGGQNCIIQSLVSSHLQVAVLCTDWERTRNT